MGQVILPPRDLTEPVTRRARIIGDEQGDLEEMAAQLEEAGDSLEDEPSLDNFNCFKDSVGRFARNVTRLAYRMEKVLIPRQRSQVVTSIIDEGGDYLYRTTMAGQQLHFQLAGEIGDIRGMILKNSA